MSSDLRQEASACSAPRARVTREGVLSWGRGVDEPSLVEGALHYDPFARPELANALAKVTDEKGALRFARHFGLLGYGELLAARADEVADAALDGRRPDPLLDRQQLARLREAGGDHYGDPLPWVYAQARSLRLALELIEALPRGAEALLAVARRHSMAQTEADGRAAARTGQLAWGLRIDALDLARDLLRARTPHDELDEELLRHLLAKGLVARLVNANLRGLEWHLYGPGEIASAGFEGGLLAGALYQIIWWHVAEAAASGKVRLCRLESCRAPFIVADQRQRFCPADYRSVEKQTGKRRPGRSRCAALYQKRHGGGRDAS